MSDSLCGKIPQYVRVCAGDLAHLAHPSCEPLVYETINLKNAVDSKISQPFF